MKLLRKLLGFSYRWVSALFQLSNTREKINILYKKCEGPVILGEKIDEIENQINIINNGLRTNDLDVMEALAAYFHSSSYRFDSFENKIENLTKYLGLYEATPFARNFVSSLLAKTVEEFMPRKFFKLNQQIQIETLRQDGVLSLKDLSFHQDQLNDIRHYFSDKALYNAHVPVYSDQNPYTFEKIKTISKIGSYQLKDTLNCPHLLDLALNPVILGIVEEYLGCTPSIFTMNAWHYFPYDNISGPQDFHRDADDYKFLALFIYLSDIKGGDAGGQHQFIKGTHDEYQLAKILNDDRLLTNNFFHPLLKSNLYGHLNICQELFRDQITDLVGVAGSVFLADTYGIHRGVPPKLDDRFVCWIRYGYGPNYSYKNDRNKPVDVENIPHKILKDPYFKYVTRLLIKA